MDLPPSGREIDSSKLMESDRSGEDARPSNLLGFNQSAADANVRSGAGAGAADSAAAQWSRSLFQSVGVAELRLSSLKASGDKNMAVMDAPQLLTPSPTSAAAIEQRGTVPFPSSELQNDVERPSAPANDEPRCTARPPDVPRKPTTSVSRLCFPFNASSASRRKKPPPAPPPARHKYSCFPSLLSPVPAGRPSPRPQRHSYRQHGYSRLALQHTKWFWTMRGDEWEGDKPDGADGNTYGGMPSSPEGILTIHPTARQGSPPPPVNFDDSSNPPMTVHPRRGDISALRDPYCVHVDRCFIGLPAWTISKTIWMHDLHLAVEKRRTRLQIVIDYDSSDAEESESEMEASIYTGYSDDSDATLVESESETDLPRLALFSTSSIYKNEDAQDICVLASSFTSTSTTPAISPLPSPSLLPFIDRLALEKATWSRSATIRSSSKRRIGMDDQYYSQDSKPQWATNWYHRWEVLMELSRRDWDRKHTQLGLVASVPPPSMFGPSSIKGMPVLELSPAPPLLRKLDNWISIPAPTPTTSKIETV